MMDELEALIGYVFVVGGRAVSMTPPGARVGLPPKKPGRGRESDTFFTLVTPAGTNQGQAAFYEQLAQLATDLYFRSSGGVTSGLREAVSGVNSHLLEYNQIAGQRYEANIVCLVLRGREIFAARAGACVVLFRQGDSFLTFPSDLSDEYALNALPLGYSPSPDIKLTHYDVAPGHVIALTDAGFASAPPEDLSTALAADNVHLIIDPLRALAAPNAQAMLIQFVTTDTPDPVIATPTPGAKIIRSSAVGPSATPAAPLSALSAAIKAPTKAPTKKIATAEIRSAPVNEELAKESITESVLAADNDSEPQPAKRTKRSVGGVFTQILDRLLPEPDENGPQIPAMLAAGLAILVPLIVVIIVVALQLSQVDQTDFEKSVAAIQKDADQAVTLGTSDSAKSAWLSIVQRIDNLETVSGHTNDPTLNDVRQKAQGILDTFDKVTRRNVVLLRSFNDTAKLVRPVIQGGGTDMYTLDTTLSAIYRDTLNPDTNTRLTTSASPIVQRGSAVGDGSTVRQLIDIIWMAEGGVPRGGNLLAALDTQGILVTYSPTFAPATSEQLPGAAQWGKPVAMSTWQGRLYVLDTGMNQIWRYLPRDNRYSDPPQEYFNTDQTPNLKNAVDIGIDSSGNVYVLFADGSIRKYNGGDPIDFSFKGLPDGNLKSGTSMFVDTDSVLPAIYITDAADQSIYQFTMQGRFQMRYRASDLSAFKNLSGVYVDKDRIYATSEASVYVFTISDVISKPTPTP